MKAIIEKDVIDEIIFRTDRPRDRLILELMARGGMRIGEVLKLTPSDIQERKLTLRSPKSGKRREHVFIPQKVADRLKAYIRDNNIQPSQRIFPICYETARTMVKKAGKKVGIRLRPHDLRRHAATYASRSGVPIEIVSKVILRHANLSRVNGIDIAGISSSRNERLQRKRYPGDFRRNVTAEAIKFRGYNC